MPETKYVKTVNVNHHIIGVQPGVALLLSAAIVLAAGHAVVALVMVAVVIAAVGLAAWDSSAA